MEILLDFVYTETVHVTVENVQELLPAACLLQLKGIDNKRCLVPDTVALEVFFIDIKLIKRLSEVSLEAWHWNL